MSPKRIQMSRQHPWRAENPNAVRVDRGPGRAWGNPFEIGTTSTILGLEGGPMHRDVTNRERAVEDFRAWINGWRFLDVPAAPSIDVIRTELRGLDLACWCPLNEPCHADVLLELANG